MAKTPWRFQADISAGVTDPDVTVFGGETFTEDATGERVVYQDTSNPMVVRLSELNAFLADPVFADPPQGMGTSGPFVRSPAPEFEDEPEPAAAPPARAPRR
jgi:hypothetical protein